MSGIPQIAGYPMPGEADLPPNTARGLPAASGPLLDRTAAPTGEAVA
ncbi:hypothetical protein [Streptomyces sp. NPDC049906]